MAPVTGLRGVLVGGPFDGAESSLEFTPPVILVYECEEETCAWRDRLHWCDSRGGINPRAEMYLLDELQDASACYIHWTLGGGLDEDVEQRRAELVA